MDRGMELKGCICRIKNCGVEILEMEEDMVVDDEDSLELVGRELRLKASFLYIDITRAISCYESEEHKKEFSVLANSFFYFMGELCDAVKSRSVPLMQVCYVDMIHALREVVSALVQSLEQ